MNSPDTQTPDGAAQKPQWRSAVVFLFKAIVTGTLITWLIRSGVLEFDRVKVLLSSTKVFAVSCASWFTLQVGVATWRWRTLLRAVGVRLPWARAAALQTTALFFNGLVPGNVGGDFLKYQNVLGNQGAKLVVMVFVERVMGLIALVWAGGVGLAISAGRVQEHPELMPVVVAMLVLLAGTIFGPLVLLFLIRSQVGVSTGGEAPGFVRRTLASARSAFEQFRSSPRIVARALAISFLMHLGHMTYFLFLTQQLGNPEAEFGALAMVYPLGMLTLVLPISIAGFGVGHVMFNELFELLGLVAGATIFNVYIVAQLAPCLLGALTYVFMSGEKKAER